MIVEVSSMGVFSVSFQFKGLLITLPSFPAASNHMHPTIGANTLDYFTWSLRQAFLSALTAPFGFLFSPRKDEGLHNHCPKQAGMDRPNVSLSTNDWPWPRGTGGSVVSGLRSIFLLTCNDAQFPSRLSLSSWHPRTAGAGSEVGA